MFSDGDSAEKVIALKDRIGPSLVVLGELIHHPQWGRGDLEDDDSW